MNPRAASEQLVAAALKFIGDGPADVGTGSGALAITIASAATRTVVWATDTSPEAVALARANVRRHGLASRIVVCHGDLLEPVQGAGDAVFAEGDGLEPYRRLLSVCPSRLSAA